MDEILKFDKVAESVLSLSDKKSDVEYEVMEIVHAYIIDNDLISYSDSDYTIYTIDALRHANDLANAIAKNSKYYVLMQTLVPYKEFIIKYDFRFSVKVIKLENYLNTNIEKMIKSISHKPYTLLPEMRLIKLYGMAYNVEYQCRWDEIKKDIEYNLSPVNVTGGTERVFELSNVIWINKDKYKCITINMKQTIIELKNMFNASYKIRDHCQMSDFREVCYVFMIKNITLEVYNCAEYELIPYYNENNLKIAHAYVQLKFFYMDLFNLEVKKYTTMDNNKYDYIKSILHKKISNSINTIDDKMVDLFGIYRPSVVDLKNLYLDSKFSNYSPTDYFKANESYRLIK